MANTVICTFRVRAGAEQAFRQLLDTHWKALHALGMVTDDPPQQFRGEDAQGRPTYVEIFTWKEDAWNAAHEHPDVQAIWGPMEALVEERDGRPKWEFPHVERL